MSKPKEHVILSTHNKGGFRLDLVAQLSGPNITNVRYSLRVYNPWTKDFIDYDPSIDDFAEFGELLISLSSFAKLTIHANSFKRRRWLRQILKPKKIHKLAPSFERYAKKGGVLDDN